MRLLAGLFFISGCMLLLQMGCVAWALGAQVLRLKDVVMGPGIAWLTHRAFYVAFHARESTGEYWPFASNPVAAFYWVFVICFSLYAV